MEITDSNETQSMFYNPFQPMCFDSNTCFLSGKKMEQNENYPVPAFPTWLLKRYDLMDASITMLSGQRMKYVDMVLPATIEVHERIVELDRLTQEAFEAGYERVIELPELTLFQWMARVMYGVIYHDFSFEWKHHSKYDRPFKISPLLQQKYTHLHRMLGSLIHPVVFEDFTPWTMRCYRVNLSKDILNYKDETQDLNFCLNMNGFGVIACLQDNGAIGRYHADLLKRIGDAQLHPAQFEELYGHMVYANYLLQHNPDYVCTWQDGKLVFQLPPTALPEDRWYAPWRDDIFAQVLTNLWKPWGLSLNQIHTFPNSPLSFLVNERTLEFIDASKVDLPY